MKKYWNLFFAVILFLLFYVVIGSAQTNKYKAYWGETYGAVSALSGCLGMQDVGSATSTTVNVGSPYKYMFLSVVTYNNEGDPPSNPVITYILYGNIYGVAEDKISYSAARIDGEDVSALAVYFGQYISNEDAKLKKRCDLTYDNCINGQDLMELGFRFGNDCSGPVF